MDFQLCGGPPVYSLDFDGVYPAQSWFAAAGAHALDAGPREGVNGYCSAAARLALTRAFAPLPERALVFLGSGNYHYASYLLLRRLTRPFALVLADRHSDMQEGLCGGVLSCGGWVRTALRTLPLLRQVFVAGIAPAYAAEVPASLRARAVFYPGEEMTDGRWAADLARRARFPLYLSVDKDVFAPGAARTNWDQGVLGPDALAPLFAAAERLPFLGGDVCGEDAAVQEPQRSEAARLNGAANLRLLGQFARLYARAPAEMPAARRREVSADAAARWIISD